MTFLIKKTPISFFYDKIFLSLQKQFCTKEPRKIMKLTCKYLFTNTFSQKIIGGGATTEREKIYMLI